MVRIRLFATLGVSLVAISAGASGYRPPQVELEIRGLDNPVLLDHDSLPYHARELKPWDVLELRAAAQKRELDLASVRIDLGGFVLGIKPMPTEAPPPHPSADMRQIVRLEDFPLANVEEYSTNVKKTVTTSLTVSALCDQLDPDYDIEMIEIIIKASAEDIAGTTNSTAPCCFPPRAPLPPTVTGFRCNYNDGTDVIKWTDNSVDEICFYVQQRKHYSLLGLGPSEFYWTTVATIDANPGTGSMQEAVARGDDASHWTIGYRVSAQGEWGEGRSEVICIYSGCEVVECRQNYGSPTNHAEDYSYFWKNMWYVSWKCQLGWRPYADQMSSMPRFNNDGRLGRFGDFNGDGVKDFFRADGSKWYVSYGGTGEWQEINTSGYRINDLAFGDFDGDGKTDIFRVKDNEFYISYSGTSPWKLVRTNTIDLDLSDLALGHFNYDDTTDIFYTNNNKWFVAFGLTTRELGPDVPIQNSTLTTPDISFGDFDGNGITDVFHRQRGKGYIYYNSVGSPQEQDSYYSDELAFGNFDETEGTDILMFSWESRYLFSSGVGTIQTYRITKDNEKGWKFSDFRFGDADSDGKTDMFYYPR